MAGTLKIQTLAERIHVEIQTGDTRAWAEMDLGQAKLIRAILSRAIDHLESGASVALSLEDLLMSRRFSATTPSAL